MAVSKKKKETLFDLSKINYKQLGHFYFGKLKNKYLLTNDSGEHVFLTEKQFVDFLENKLPQKKEPYTSLYGKGFVKSESSNLGMVEKYRSKHAYLFGAPSLQIVVVTLRCNFKCVYCSATSQDILDKKTDMTLETAVKVVDTIFKSPSQWIAIEFQGGEPLLNWEVIKFITERALKKNKTAKKDLQIRIVSNFSLMTEEKLKYLMDKNVSLCVSLDGPKKIHDKNRILPSGSSYEHVVKWIEKFQKLSKVYKKGNNYGYKLAVSVTITRFSLPYHKQIVDECLRFGFGAFYFRPLSPFGASSKNWKKIAYTADDFIKFYKNMLDYMIDLNKKGIKVTEKLTMTFLAKILTDKDPNHLDYRSPCGAGIGQIAYDWDGGVYTCDEGRMVSMMGDENFKLGSVFKNNYKELISNPVVRTMCVASCSDNVPGCCTCVFKPYCGVCPLYNYVEQGNIFGQMPTNERCSMNKAIFNYIFEKLEDKKSADILKKWVE